MQISSTPAAAAARLQALESTHGDTTEINHTEPNATSYTVGGTKPSNIFGLMSRALNRPKETQIANKAVFTQVEEDIRHVYGEDTAKAFARTMQSKKDYGSPLTKGALARFLKTQNASTDVIAHKVAEAIDVLIKDDSIRAGPSKHGDYASAEYNKLESLTGDYSSLLTSHYGAGYGQNGDTPSYDLKAFFTRDQIKEIKSKLFSLNRNEGDLSKLFARNTSKADRIEILKKVLNPPHPTGNVWEGDQETV